MCKIAGMRVRKERKLPAPRWETAAIGAILLLSAGCAAVGASPLPQMAPASGQVATTAPAPTAALLTPPPVTVHKDPVVLVLPTSTPTAAPIGLAGLLPTPTAAPLLPSPTSAPPARAPFAPTPDGVVRTLRVPILMYHYLSTPPADADIYRTDLSVPPELFAPQLDRILADGYTTVDLYALQEYLTRGVPLPEKPVIITFDDGYRDNYVNAFPLLRERGMVATFFVVTDFIDEERPEYLTWDMVREMHAGGMSIESHSRNHASLKGKDADFLVWQALGSQETITYELGVRPRFVSYPAGEFDQLTIDIFASAGYWAGLTTIQGATLDGADPFRLPRVRVRNTTTPDDLSRLLALDW